MAAFLNNALHRSAYVKALLPAAVAASSFKICLLPVPRFLSFRPCGSLSISASTGNSLLANSNPPRWRNRRQLSVTAAATREASSAVDVAPVDTRAPATIITGFLGSGKTTLLNYVLKANHGKRIAVIENEIGEVDIDGSLVAAQQTESEDIIMLNNGCLCCTVRGDLVRMLSELVHKRRDKFDHILIETTGLANPSPIIQTFYFEDKVAHHIKLDGVVTLVDAKHAPFHLDQVKPGGIVNEAVEQIAYADRIILNKTDLVGESELDKLVHRVKHINGIARLQRAKFGEVDIDYVLGVGGYDLERIETEMKAANSDKDHARDHHHKDDHVCDENCEHDHDHDNHARGHAHNISVHDPGVTSVSIVCDGVLDLEKINIWLGTLLQERNEEIYRTKGVLCVEGIAERFVFQAVHALYEGGTDRLWGADEKKTNKIVFIGKNLNKDSLQTGFQRCLVKGQ